LANMHEISVAASIVEVLAQDAEKNGLRKVSRFLVVIGELSMVNADALDFALRVLVQGTIADGASFELKREEALAECPACRTEVRPEPPFLTCPQCGASLSRFTRGKRIHLEYYEGE